MYMSKVTLEMSRLGWGKNYWEHQAIWKLFSDSPQRTRDFLFRKMGEELSPDGGMKAHYLIVSEREPRAASFAEIRGLKEYAPVLHAGERLFFSLRVNPVRKVRDENGRQIRHDIVQDLRKKKMAEGEKASELPNRIAFAEVAAQDWLSSREDRLGLSIEPETLLVDRYESDSFYKPHQRGKVTVATLDMRGFGVVTDPEALQRTLFSGVGPAKSFGCGLLLVRRA